MAKPFFLWNLRGRILRKKVTVVSWPALSIENHWMDQTIPWSWWFSGNPLSNEGILLPMDRNSPWGFNIFHQSVSLFFGVSQPTTEVVHRIYANNVHVLKCTCEGKSLGTLKSILILYWIWVVWGGFVLWHLTASSRAFTFLCTLNQLNRPIW